MNLRGQSVSQLDRPRHVHATYAYVGDALRRDRHAGPFRP